MEKFLVTPQFDMDGANDNIFLLGSVFFWRGPASDILLFLRELALAFFDLVTGLFFNSESLLRPPATLLR
jgi:hypothetical protein